jgi:hypothetical protein
LKDLLFEKLKGGVIKFHGGEDAIGIQPSLKAGVDAIEVKKRHPLIHLQYVGIVNNIKAIRLVFVPINSLTRLWPFSPPPDSRKMAAKSGFTAAA